MAAESFYDILNQAIADMQEHGFDSMERVAFWQEKLRRAAQAAVTPDERMTEFLQNGFRQLYKSMIDNKEILKRNPGIGRFTLEKVKPALRAELNRRLAASANLVRLNREKVISQLEQRWSGWATSIPAGGTDQVKRKEVKEGIKKGLASLPFEERRVLTDQGHKMVSSLNEILAKDGGAIAAIWHSNYHQINYDYREPHKEREIESKKKPYVVRGNWALEAGLMKLDGAKYTDSMTQPAEEIFCRCHYQFIYNLHDLPDSMITAKGRASIKAAAEA